MLYKFRQGKNAVEATNATCSVCAIDALELKTCQGLFARFSSGCYDLEYQQRCGILSHSRPQEAKSKDLLELLDENPRQTTIELTQKLSVHQSTISRRLHELGKIQKSGKWVLYELSEGNMI